MITRQETSALAPAEGDSSGHTEMLLPAEKVALAVALARLLRGDEPLPNTTSVCVLALARLAGVHDYTAHLTDEKQICCCGAFEQDGVILHSAKCPHGAAP
jgi:hypothetical protein